MTTVNMDFSCLLCGFHKPKICLDLKGHISVTSDCKPWRESPAAYSCPRCSHLQKASHRKTDEVYKNYEIYQLSGGAEQVIFSEAETPPQSRTTKILDHLADFKNLPSKGRMLDVGCGNGASLVAFHHRYPGWELFGFEQSPLSRQRVLKLPGVKDFFFGALSSIPSRLDLITAIHVLEHVLNPAAFLKEIRSLLQPDGILLIQVPNILQMPFDTVVFDHYSHFSPELLRSFVTSLGFNVTLLATDWVTKEITVIASLGEYKADTTWYSDLPISRLIQMHKKGGEWLKEVLIHAKKVANRCERFGIFGTAIAGTWLGATLEGKVDYFVDEDPNRVGKIHLGKPVLHPNELTKEHNVYLSFPFEMAQHIQSRLSQSFKGIYFSPPAFTFTI